MLRYSLLDLCPVNAGEHPSDALRNTLDLAQHAEKLGYHRYWLAEHHNMPGIASAATSVVIAHVAAGTKTIRVGSGGVMLPNHAPLVIAEQFGTLDALHPGRIDLGIGRAPGTDQRTAAALRRDMHGSEERFIQDVLQVQAFLAPLEGNPPIRAVPGYGSQVPMWLLGSSLFSADLAARLGLPFAFASHFAPDMLMDALTLYRHRFEPSDQLDKPYAIAAMGLFAADSDEEGQYLATSMQQQFLNLRRGTPGQLPKPVKDMSEIWNRVEKAGVDHAMRYAAIGGRDTVAQKLREFAYMTNADEIMVTANIYDQAARQKSFKIAADLFHEMNAKSSEQDCA
ncbi:LLM class flavin-dependent oxidoreductase [Thalassospira lucentensis]|uniref:LLM class flavin-dependent oxidoreductase n=1 Tax=Thalassospira lucentensis TaxID=168935 RepID=UPI003D2EF5D6